MFRPISSKAGTRPGRSCSCTFNQAGERQTLRRAPFGSVRMICRLSLDSITSSEARAARTFRRNSMAARPSSMPVKPPTGQAPSQTKIAAVRPQRRADHAQQNPPARARDRLRCGMINASNRVASSAIGDAPLRPGEPQARLGDARAQDQTTQDPSDDAAGGTRLPRGPPARQSRSESELDYTDPVLAADRRGAVGAGDRRLGEQGDAWRCSGGADTRPRW